MKTLLLCFAILLAVSCDKDCKRMEDEINDSYHKALQNARTPEAVNELTRQRNEQLARLDC